MTRQLYYILHDTLMTDLASQLAKANRYLLVLIKKNVLQEKQKKNYLRETRIALFH